MPRSIRARLTLSLLGGLAVAAAVIGAITYHNVLREAETLFDYQLRQMALSLRDQGEIAPGAAAAFNDPDLDFVVQIWRIDGRSVYASRDHRALPTRAVLGYADLQAEGGGRWRTFAVAAGERVIQVAQPLTVRRNLAADAALRGVWPLVGAAPLLAAGLWALVERLLRPLSRLARQVGERDAAALGALPEDGLPDEVAPLVHSLNQLLARLGAALDSQRAFVADAAHELRSPLTALKLQAQLIERAPDAASRREAQAALVAGVDRATRLVAQLLALARSEPGAAQPPLEPVALLPLARQVLADTAPLAQSRGSRLELNAPGLADDTTLAADPAALAVLLRNLVDNALRYTPAGGRVVVTLQREASQWTLQVDDSGPGIAAADRERVFERFVRGDYTGAETGSGLGLAIVEAIARRHGGQISLDDAPLGGLRARVSLPDHGGVAGSSVAPNGGRSSRKPGPAHKGNAE